MISYCPECGKPKRGDGDTCSKCGSSMDIPPLEVHPALAEPEPVQPSLLLDCPSCSQQVSRNAHACPSCGEPIAPPEAPSKYSATAAVLLSFFFPGLGQLYTGRVITGILWFGLLASGYLIGLLTLPIGLGLLILPGCVFVHLLCLGDAAWGAS